MIYLALYLILQADILKPAFSAAAVILAVWLIAVALFRFIESRTMWDKFAKRIVIAIIATGAMSVIIPSTKNAALIVGGGQVYNVLTSNTAQELAGDVMDKVREAISGKPSPAKVTTQQASN